MSIRLQLPGNFDLLPQGNIYMLEGKATASTKTDLDIYGNQIVVTQEVKNSNQLWTIGAAYVDLTTTQNAIAAYETHLSLLLTDEAGGTFNTIVTEYPAIDRHKLVDGNLAYTVRLTLGKSPTSWSIPVINLNAPRQFDR